MKNLKYFFELFESSKDKYAWIAKEIEQIDADNSDSNITSDCEDVIKEIQKNFTKEFGRLTEEDLYFIRKEVLDFYQIDESKKYIDRLTNKLDKLTDKEKDLVDEIEENENIADKYQKSTLEKKKKQLSEIRGEIDNLERELDYFDIYEK